MARVLFVVDTLPFPVRNGVTVPSANHLRALSQQHEVSLLWLKVPGTPSGDEEFIDINRQHVKHLWIQDLAAVSSFRAVTGEILCRKPAFAAARLDIEACASALRGYDCDILWGTPHRPGAYLSLIESVLPTKRRRCKIVAINDSWTGTLRSEGRNMLNKGLRPGIRGELAVKWCRSIVMGRLEAIELRQADAVLVQTPVDKQWVGRASGRELLERTVILPNGVNEEFFSVPLSRPRPRFGHVGPLWFWQNAQTIEPLVTTVWPQVRQACPEAVFSIVGHPGSASLMRQIRDSDGITYVPEVDCPANLYRNLSAIVIRKEQPCGLLNRALGAMAAGTVVLGPPATFNGITGFVDGRHGVVIRSPRRAGRPLAAMLSDEARRLTIARQARELVRRHFSWADRDKKLLGLVDCLLQRTGASGPTPGGIAP